MPRIVKYPDVVPPGSTINFNTTLTTKRVPCWGAKAVIFVIRATGGTHQALTTTAVVGYGNATDGGFFNYGGVQIFDGATGKDPFNNGVVVALTPSNASSNMHYHMAPYLAIGIANPTGGSVNLQGVTCDAFVFYEGSGDQGQLGQDGAVAV
jgi:hypothetical protein